VATLYKPNIVTYRLKDGSYRTPDGKRVTRDTPGAVRSVGKAKKWYGRYTDGAGKPCRVPLSESKETARRMLTKLAGDSQLAGVGIVDPYAEHRHRPLLEHVEDFGRYLAARGNTEKYCSRTVSHVRGVIEGCRFRYLHDLQPSAVVGFLADLRRPRKMPGLDPAREWYTAAEVAALVGVIPATIHVLLYAGKPLPGPAPQHRPGLPTLLHRDMVAGLLERRARGLGVSTSNDHLGSVKRFSRWLVKDGRAAVDPLAHLEKLNAETDVRHARRALRAEDFGSFVEATVGGKAFRGLKGTDRLVLYTLAANTGFRAKELGSLEPASFDFGARPPTVTVEAAFSKHRRRDVQPLRPDVAEVMRGYVAGRPPRARLWPGNWQKRAAEMVRIDLAAAGIPYEDVGGRLFDFHAMRGQFISLLAAQGVHPKVAQVLARHSTITLTMDYYTHLDVLDVAGALDKLPALPAAHGEKSARGEAQSA
jgi:integrase